MYKQVEFATKKNLENLEQSITIKLDTLEEKLRQEIRYRILKLVVICTYAGGIVILGGMLAKGFHWF